MRPRRRTIAIGPRAGGSPPASRVELEDGPATAFGAVVAGRHDAADRSERRSDPRRPSTSVERDQRRIEPATSGNDAQRPGDRLGALRGPAHPEQRVDGPRRDRSGQVDLRERSDNCRERPRLIEDPHVLDGARRRALRVVAGRQHTSVAAGHDRDAVRAGDRVQADHHRHVLQFGTPERRNRPQLRRPCRVAELGKS